MRTTKLFTPDLLDRFRKEGRGHGTYIRYRPWHGVSRGDPASLGRSHLMTWGGRQRNLLSDDEWVASLFTPLTPGSDDLREQFPLSLESGCHELGAYDVRLGKPGFPGTIEIARQLGYRHPRVNGNGRSAPWVFTTDLLFTLMDETGTRKLLAVACKPTAKQEESKKRLLAIERAYWLARGVEWLLITPDQYDEAIELTLRTSFQWWQGEPIAEDAKRAATALARQLEGFPLTYVLDRINEVLGQGLEYAQVAFWQSVWTRALPLDLRRGWRPHLPVEFLSPSDFLAFNPIASRRTAWN
ncbi:MAG: TnsA endonuclease N-terminal domain-containing protein [Burkholderiaceae bacterium]|jgi:hypothetical protein|nr:TnsA endonuclease N-terminal domain-containing protein [Burkholderiaceae bacterium]